MSPDSSSSPVLALADLRVVVDGHPAVDGIDLTVAPGQRWGLIGESGAGKSLTAAAVAGLLPPAAWAQGSAVVAGTELVGAPEPVLAGVRGRDVTLVAQDSATALHPLVPVGRQVAAPLRDLHGLDRRAAAARVGELLARVGLPAGTAAARPAQLSGGQRQRVALAAALACGSRLLVADEPTAALDPTIARDLLDELDRVLRGPGDRPDGSGTALLLVTHELGVLAAVCEYVAVLRDGVIVERGRVDEVLAAPAHEYTRELVDAARALAPRAAPDDPVDLADPAAAGPPPPAVPGPRDPGPDGAGMPPPTADEVPTIAVRGVRHAYRVPGTRPWRTATRTVLRDVDLTLAPGRSLALVGESGAGKSTLLRLVLALEAPGAGGIRFRGRPVTPDDGAAAPLRREIGVVVQDAGSSLDPRMRVGESLREPLDVLGIPTDDDHASRIADMLVAVGLDPAAVDRRPAAFSGGQRQRLALARALLPEPSVLVVDEPFSAVDPSTRARLVTLVETLVARTGVQLVMVTHDLGVARRLCDDVVVLHDGRVAEAGPLAEVFDRPRSDAAAALLAAVPRPTLREAR